MIMEISTFPTAVFQNASHTASTHIRQTYPPLKVVFSPLSGHSGVAPTQKWHLTTLRGRGVTENEPMINEAFFVENIIYRLISEKN